MYVCMYVYTCTHRCTNIHEDDIAMYVHACIHMCMCIIHGVYLYIHVIPSTFGTCNIANLTTPPTPRRIAAPVGGTLESLYSVFWESAVCFSTPEYVVMESIHLMGW